MSTPIFLVIFIAFVISAVILLINIMGEPGVDYWELDSSNEPPISKLDFLRMKTWLYGSAVVLVASAISYFFLR
jgi:hypothetical protein